jgi:hypothetical protein
MANAILKRVGMVSLLELLRLYAEQFVYLSSRCTQVYMQVSIEGETELRESSITTLLETLRAMHHQCVDLGLTLSSTQIERMAELWESKHNTAVLQRQCAELVQRIQDEFRERVVLMLPSTVQVQYENPRKGWGEAISKFPQITDNVDEMARCFALSRYPGAVFHSLLIAEAGLIELGDYLGVTDPVKGWDATSRRLAELVRNGRSALPPGMSFPFVEQVNQTVQAMKQAWRNKVSHEVGRLIVLDPLFTSSIAEEIIIATRGFMRRLATSAPKLP